MIMHQLPFDAFSRHLLSPYCINSLQVAFLWRKSVTSEPSVWGQEDVVEKLPIPKGTPVKAGVTTSPMRGFGVSSFCLFLGFLFVHVMYFFVYFFSGKPELVVSQWSVGNQDSF